MIAVCILKPQIPEIIAILDCEINQEDFAFGKFWAKCFSARKMKA
jgi:hypothetical protein